MSALMSFRIERFHSRAAARQLNKKKKKMEKAPQNASHARQKGEKKETGE